MGWRRCIIGHIPSANGEVALAEELWILLALAAKCLAAPTPAGLPCRAVYRLAGVHKSPSSAAVSMCSRSNGPDMA